MRDESKRLWEAMLDMAHGIDMDLNRESEEGRYPSAYGRLVATIEHHAGLALGRKIDIAKGPQRTAKQPEEAPRKAKARKRRMAKPQQMGIAPRARGRSTDGIDLDP